MSLHFSKLMTGIFALNFVEGLVEGFAKSQEKNDGAPSIPSAEDLKLPPVLYSKLAAAAWADDRSAFMRHLDENNCPWDLTTKVDLWKMLGGK